MPIDLICPGCHARFKVSEKFAGKKGPCPKCKQLIRVPAADEQVVIHVPEHSELGAKDTEGRYVLKPIERKESRARPLVITAIVGLSIIVLVVAILFRGEMADNSWVLYLGALLLAPPLCLGGYSFLHDQELEPYSGRSLALRTAMCSVVYALSWLAYSYLYFRILGDAPVETWNVLPFAVAFMALGAGTAYVCYDLDLGSGFFHYCLYLLVTILLRLAMGLPPV